MITDLFITSLILQLGTIFFGHFEELVPKWIRLRKLAFFLGGTAGLSRRYGHRSLWLVTSMAALGGTFHLWWCRKHGIDPIRAEPRDEYNRLIRAQYDLGETV